MMPRDPPTPNPDDEEGASGSAITKDDLAKFGETIVTALKDSISQALAPPVPGGGGLETPGK